jgi:predicted XRE-type DNA-binding protein
MSCTALRRKAERPTGEISRLLGSVSNWSDSDSRSKEQMKNAAENKPTHIVKGSIFDALGFSSSEASTLKIKADLLSAILEYVKRKGYTQAQLVRILDEYQPSVSNLLRGRISQVSIEKLLRYADRLHLQTSIAVRPIDDQKRSGRTRPRPTARRSTRKLAAVS